MRLIIYTLLTSLFLFNGALFGQVSQVEFGKNRVQYHQDFKEWMMYESQNFITYWYGEGRSIGQSVVQMAEFDFEHIQNILEHRMNNKIEIIVYKDLTDLKQSNLGSEEAFVNTGGQTKIVGNKVFIYFNGDHNHLRAEVREGIASVYLNAMMFGSNLQEIVQNAVMLNLPVWFKDGLVSYVSDEWNVELDNELRDILLRDEYKDFDRFSDDYPILAGHSLWYYISQNYGRSTVSNLLYLTRINRSIESGFLYVLGTSYKKTTQNWMQYFTQRYQLETKRMDTPGNREIEIKNKKKLPVSQLKISPDGNKIAYVLNEIGKVKLYIQDIHTGDRKLVLKKGFRNAFQETDYNYPLIAWNPNNMELGVIYEKQDIIKLLLYDLNTSEKVVDVIPNQFQRIYSMDYINAANMVFSAAVRGTSDIFTYSPVTRQTERITNDFWDDLDASYVHVDSVPGILFASNRLDTMLVSAKLDSILPIFPFDIYFYNLKTNSKELVQVTNTPYANERNPVGIDSMWFSYTSDISGINNRQVGYLKEVSAYYEKVVTLKDGSEIILHRDSTLSKLDTATVASVELRPVYKKRAFTHNRTNYSRNIVQQHASKNVNKLVEVVYHSGKYQLFIHNTDSIETTILAKETRFRAQTLKAVDLSFSPLAPEPTPKIEINSPEKPTQKPTPKKAEKVIDDYLFQSEFDDEEKPPKVVVEKDEGTIVIEDIPILTTVFPEDKTEPKLHKFRPGRIVPYRLKFRTDYVTTQFDNSLLFGGLNSYTGTKNEYNYPPPGILLKANFKDLFEDYQVEGGVRLPTTFNGAEYFLLYDNKKKRLDKRYALYRRALKNSDETVNASIGAVPAKERETVFLMQYGVRYPLDIFRSLRATATLRFDKTIQLSTEQNTLNTPTFKQQRLGIRVEYVFDNTLDVDVNIKNGTRYKAFVEVLKRFDIDFTDRFEFDLSEGFMTVLGVDARHYQRLDKHSILAARFAASTSFGSERILFFLGGVDNWLLPRFNQDIPLPTAEGLAYQTFANNLRGFKTNIRNGTSYALVNTELRVPIFKYFSRRVRSSFFRNFQLIGFFDFGTAWEGWSPYSNDNPLNTLTISNVTTSVEVNYFRDPIVAGYGVGLRTVLFGYFLRLDYAWGIETRIRQNPMLYFSLGMDF